MQNEETTAPKEQAKSKAPRLSKEMKNEVIKLATQTAIQVHDELKKKDAEEADNKRFRNTKLLLQKYRWLNEYNNNGIYEVAQLCADGEDDIMSILGIETGDGKRVESLRRNIMVTRTMMAHIDTMLDCYKRKCKESDRPEITRRWRVIYGMYISPEKLTAQEIADKEFLSVSQIYLDIDKACEELKLLFFGIDLSQFI